MSSFVIPRSLYQHKKAVLLDLDNTVYSYDACHTPSLNACQALLNLDLIQFQALYCEARDDVHHRLSGTAAMHHRLLYFKKMLELLEHRTLCKTALQLDALYWSTFLDHMNLYPWVIPFLSDCKNLGIKIALVTDLTTQIQLQKVLHLNLESKIDAIVTSEEAGAEKPDSRIFLLALTRLHCKPEDAFMIGDNIQKDIEGANRIPIDSFLICT